MDEQTQYENMLGIDGDSTTITNKPLKRKKVKKVDVEKVKNKLADKVNAKVNAEIESEQNEVLDVSIMKEQEKKEQSVNIVVKPKKKFVFSVIGAQVAVIALLVLTIAFTSLTYENSGINTVLKNLFNENNNIKVDNRVYSEFKPVFTTSEDVSCSMVNGAVALTGKGSVYSPCDGEVVSVSKNSNGLYDIEVSYSENFKATFSGLKYAYTTNGQKALSKVPIGYFEGSNCSVCFNDQNGEALTCYTLIDNAVIWEV